LLPNNFVGGAVPAPMQWKHHAHGAGAARHPAASKNARIWFFVMFYAS